MVDLKQLSEVLTFGSIIIGVQLVISLGGAILPAPNTLLSSCMQHFSAGVVTAAISVELLPLLLEIFTPSPANYASVITSFIFSVVFFSVIGHFAHPPSGERRFFG